MTSMFGTDKIECKSNDHYHRSLFNLMERKKGEDIIPYDKVLYGALGDFVEKKELRDRIDMETFKRIAMILDDPTHLYEGDQKLILRMLSHFLPKMRQLLHIRKNYSLQRNVVSREPVLQKDGETVSREFLPAISDVMIVNRLITQQLELYHCKKMSGEMLTKVLQAGPPKGYIDTSKPYTLEVDTVPALQKTIIINLMLLMLIQEELQTKGDYSAKQ